MSDGMGSRFLPDHLSAVPDRWHARLRPLWLMVLVLTLFLDIAGTVWVLRDAFVYDPHIHRLGLVTQLENDGSLTVETRPYEDGRPPDIPPLSRIEAIDGRAVPIDTLAWDMAELLVRPEGATVDLTFRTPDGSQVRRRVVSTSANLVETGPSAAISRETAIWIRIVIALLACFALTACAALLYVRRARDPVALLISFSFLMLAGSIDPPMNLWMATGFGAYYDAYIGTAWLLLVIALATFPDGRFVPRFLRWLLVLTPLLVIPISIDETPMWANLLIGFIFPLMLVGTHIAKYRRYSAGIERQQLKWAAFGFAIGLALLTVALWLAEILPDSSPYQRYYGLGVLLLFDGGFVAMAVGLLVSLIRFRLWEADRVISKSAVSAAVTVVVGILWTMSVDLVKTAVEFTLGHENAMVSTAVGAVLAAGIFAPTQALAQRWANNRLGSDRDKIAALNPRLLAWRATERPDEIGQRALASLASTAHISSGAILVDTPRGRTLIAARDVMNPEALAEPGNNPEGDGRFVLKLPLEDEDGPVGLLLLGPRNDYNRYNSDELEGLRAITEPLADSIRGAMRRTREVDSMQQMLSTVEERLARLEGGPNPSAA
jgi:hypothetical protein